MSDAGTPVQLMPADGMGDQEGKVLPAGDGICTIMNVRSTTFLGFEGDSDHNVLVCGFSGPRAWQLTPGERPGNFGIVPPGSELVHAAQPGACPSTARGPGRLLRRGHRVAAAAAWREAVDMRSTA